MEYTREDMLEIVKGVKDQDKKESGFETIDEHACHHPEHFGPTHLYIPAGQQYRHVCPGCGQNTILRGSGATY